MAQIKINDKDFNIPEITFGSMRKLEKEYDITQESILNYDKHTWSILSGMVAFTEKISLEEADKEIDEHLKNGGNLGDFTPLINAIADFFTRPVRK